MTVQRSQPGTAPAIQPCPLCKKAPGQKVGPPALVRCINRDCDGAKLAALTPDEWNTRANWSDFAASAAVSRTPSPAGAREGDGGIIDRLRNRANDAPIETERLLDDAADEIAALREANHHYRDAAAQRDSGVQTPDVAAKAPTPVDAQSIAAVIDPVAFDPISLNDTHPSWLCRREVALETANKILALGPAQATPDRHALAAMLKENGFCSRDGTVVTGGTLGVIDAILSSLSSTNRGGGK